MAKVQDVIDIMMRMLKLAKKESEQLDFTNQMAGFCADYGNYFDDIEFYNVFAESLVNAIDYANRIDYEYEQFKPYYYNAIEKFVLFTAAYKQHIYENPFITFLLPVYHYKENILPTIENITSYPSDDIEMLVADYTDTPALKKMLQNHKNGKIRYCNPISHGFAKDRIYDANQCKGKFIFPIEAGNILTSDSVYNLIYIIKNNPGAGCIFSAESQVVVKGDKLLFYPYQPNELKARTHISSVHNPGFGFVPEAVNLEDEKYSLLTKDDFYITIAEEIIRKYESVFSGVPLLKKETELTDK